MGFMVEKSWWLFCSCVNDSDGLVMMVEMDGLLMMVEMDGL